MHHFLKFHVYNIHRVGTKNLTKQNVNDNNSHKLYYEPLIGVKL